MEISFFTPRFYPAISGGEFYILNLALEMSKKFGDTPRILCSDSIDFRGLTDPAGLTVSKKNPSYYSYLKLPVHRIKPRYREAKNEGIQREELKLFSKICERSNITADLNTLRQFLHNGPNFNRYFRDFSFRKTVANADVVHSTYLPYSNIIYSLVIAGDLKIPSVCTPFYHIYNPRFNNAVYTDVLKLFDGLIACTNREKEFLVESGIEPGKVKAIPMGVDFDLYSTPVKSQSGRIKSFRDEFKISKPFVLFCGHKNYEKGAINLLKSAVLLDEDHNNVEYVFIGPSTQAFDIELKKTRRQGIRILNLTPRNMKGYYDWRKISAFQECSVFAMPSRSDAYGMAYLEAWASGKPVIAAKTPVMEEVISEGKDGILVDFDSMQALSDAILSLLADRDLSEKFGRTGQEKVRSNNSWSDVAQKTRDFYLSLLEEKGS